MPIRLDLSADRSRYRVGTVPGGPVASGSSASVPHGMVLQTIASL